MKEKLQCFKYTREEANDYDKYANDVYRELKTEQIETAKERVLVGHIPIEISQQFYHFLNAHPSNKL